MAVAVTRRSCSTLREKASSLLVGELPERQWRPLVDHLTACPHCAHFVSAFMPTLSALHQLRVKKPDVGAEVRALSAFSRTARGSYGRHENSSPDRPDDIQEILGEVASSSENQASEQLRQTCEALCKNAITESYRLPRNALQLAKAAVSLYERNGALGWNNDVGARCYQVLAVALVEASEVASARVALDTAFRLFSLGTQPDHLKVKLFSAGYHIYQRTISADDAQSLLLEAEGIFGDLSAAGQSRAAQMSVACLRLVSGDVDKAIPLLEEMKSAIDERTPLGDQFIIYLNLSLAYCEAGKVELAEALQGVLAEKAGRLGGHSQISAYWLKGTLARVKGDWKEALSVFEEIREFFAERGEYLHFLEASLDICRVYSAVGAWQQLALVVGDTVSRAEECCEDPVIGQALSLLEEGVKQKALSDTRIKVVSALVARASGRWSVR